MKRILKISAIVMVPVLVIAAVLGVMLTPHGAAAATGDPVSVNPNTDGPVAGADVDTGTAIVQLTGDPLSTYVKTKPAPGKKIDFNSNTTKSYRAQLSAERNSFKQWLQTNAPQANVTGQFDIALNAVAVSLNGTALSTLMTAPMVQTAQYEGLYQPDGSDPDLNLIHAEEAWSQNGFGGSATAGTGVKVAIVDTGIDITNPCFSDAGYAPQQQLGDTHFTNNKVIVAKVFANKTPGQYTPEALQDHGTHVAGTVACDFGTTANVNGVAIPHTISGVAPHALLGNYNVFPGAITNARSEDILNALEAAYTDGFDVDNMSLGGGPGKSKKNIDIEGNQDLLSIAVDDLDQAGMISAVAAGNDGPGFSTVESPGRAARALTAGAMSVGHVIGTPITVGGNTYAGVTGDFATVSSDTTAHLQAVTEAPTNAVTGLSTACSSLSTSLTGNIALISRGTCSFSTKIRNAQNAGAAVVLVVNNVAGDGIAMAQDGTPNQPTVFAYNVSITAGAALAAASGSLATIGSNPAYILTGNDNIMAGFSSQGPTTVDFRVKPDVVAPGVNVLSSIPHQFCAAPPCFAFFQGTSMATPHLAGSAAIVIQQHPDWSAEQVRSAIVNTADQGVLKNFRTGATETNINIIGAGRDDLNAAVQASVTLDPVSVSFGAVPSGSGQTQTFNVSLTNVTTGSATYALSVDATSSGVTYAVSPSSVTVPAGQSATVTITMTADKAAPVLPTGYMSYLRVKSGSAELAHAAVFTYLK
jgi:subtilisin family serine protease